MSPTKAANKVFQAAVCMMHAEKPDTAAIVPMLQEAIAGGSADAAYALATWYLYGKDDVVRQDFTEAVQLLELAIEGKNVDALYDLAVCYHKGEGVEKDPAKGFELYLRAALRGDAQAVFQVGQAYYNADGISEDRRLAEIWYDRAIELGSFEEESGAGNGCDL